jgi:hypothetical protein
MELLSRRETELSNIYKYSGRGFFCAYGLGVGFMALRRGSLPFFRDVMKHTVLCVGGTFVFAKMAEKVASEGYYN